MVRIRLRREGKKGQPHYRIVAADKEAPRDGRFLEILGHYNPRTEPATISVKEDRVYDWISKGAQPSDSVMQIFRQIGALERIERFKQGEDVETLLAEAESARVEVDPRTKRDHAAPAPAKKAAPAKAPEAEKPAAAAAEAPAETEPAAAAAEAPAETEPAAAAAEAPAETEPAAAAAEAPAETEPAAEAETPEVEMTAEAPAPEAEAPTEETPAEDAEEAADEAPESEEEPEA